MLDLDEEFGESISSGTKVDGEIYDEYDETLAADLSDALGITDLEGAAREMMSGILKTPTASKSPMADLLVNLDNRCTPEKYTDIVPRLKGIDTDVEPREQLSQLVTTVNRIVRMINKLPRTLVGFDEVRDQMLSVTLEPKVSKKELKPKRKKTVESIEKEIKTKNFEDALSEL